MHLASELAVPALRAAIGRAAREVAMSGDTVRLAALADVHCNRNSQGLLGPIFARLADTADVLLLAGDLVDYGLPEEARILAKELAVVKLPIIAVLGNHEYESGQAGEVVRILCDAGVIMLDGDTYETHGIGFAGVKGFGGGFGRAALQPWGEETIKRFVHEAVDEALKLESALAKLRTPQRVALVHYSPIQATVEGEPPEIYAFLGSSRLEEPLNRYPVAAVFHGHAHHGTAEGHTSTGIPVYNVALPLMRRTFPDRLFRIFELPVVPTETTDVASAAPTNNGTIDTVSAAH
jgi:Icc-related predicted phosphoesterase